MAIADIVGRGLGCSAATDGFIVTLGFGPVWSSVYGRVLLATQQSIQSLGLDGIDPSSVVVQKLPVDRHLGIADGVALPAILITPEGETIDPASGTNLMDDVTYAVRVTLVDRDNQEPTLVANVDRYFVWRQRIARTFRNQTLAAVPEIYTTTLDPGDVVDSAAWESNLFASVLTLRFVSREPRGPAPNPSTYERVFSMTATNAFLGNQALFGAVPETSYGVTPGSGNIVHSPAPTSSRVKRWPSKATSSSDWDCGARAATSPTTPGSDPIWLAAPFI